ncbi:MAG: hypothetical protein ACE5GR_00625 [Nitrosopumilus sp.]
MIDNDEGILEKTVFQFIKNRSIQNESTASRHIHRRFDISMEQAEQILINLLEKNLIVEFYDKEYQENRFTTKNTKTH